MREPLIPDYILRQVEEDESLVGLRKGTDSIVECELRRMMKASAPITHPMGNRRYKDYVMLIEDDILRSITYNGKGHCGTCNGQGSVLVSESCNRCSGRGCGNCDNGWVEVFIKCQDCQC